MPKESEILRHLNPAQRQAVTTVDGPVLILAGAGSGKTRALTHRIAYLIGEKKIAPYNILAVTFTNKAAGEMKERVRKLVGGASRRLPTIGTFHSVCARILRQEIEVLGFKRHFLIYDDSDTLSVIKKSLLDLDIDPKEFNPRAVRELISSAKNELVTPQQYEETAAGLIQETAARVYFRYQKFLKDNNALDFDDLLMKTVELFQKFPEVLEKYRHHWRYILVDEYQDTNKSQYVFVNLLAQKHRNLCVVGDDWQSIYSWRGADIRNILEFEKDYPKAKVVMLEQNYRSTKNILSAAQEVIATNVNKKDKNLWTQNEAGEPVRLYEAADERDEARYIIDKVREYQRQGHANRAMAVLYRTNAQSRVLEEALLRSSIPYNIVGALKFYERKEIKDILAYLRLVASGNDFISFARIINEPSRGVGEKTLEKLDQLAEKHGLAPAIKKIVSSKEISAGDGLESWNLPPRAREGLTDLQNLLSQARKYLEDHTIGDLIDHIALASGYKKMILDGTEEGEARWENIQELKSVAAKYDESRGEESLEKFLEEVALVQDLDRLDESADAITLMTVHSAKGLEYPIVFIAGLEEGLFPHARSYLDPAALEEERRLCYVGMTRAKQRLFLTYAVSRKLYGSVQFNLPSQFLEIGNLEKDPSTSSGWGAAASASFDDISTPLRPSRTLRAEPLRAKPQDFAGCSPSRSRAPENKKPRKRGGGILDQIIEEKGGMRYEDTGE